MIRLPGQIDKAHPMVEHIDAALQEAALVYPMANRLLRSWDDMPMSIRAAIAMEVAERHDDRRARETARHRGWFAHSREVAARAIGKVRRA